MTDRITKNIATMVGTAMKVMVSATKFLPLAFFIQIIRLHNSESLGYENYLNKTVGPDALSRSTDAMNLPTWATDSTLWTNARISYWSDLLAVSISSYSLFQMFLTSLILALLAFLLHSPLPKMAESSVVKGNSGVAKN